LNYRRLTSMENQQGEQMIGAIKIKDGLFIGDELAALVII